MKKNKKLILALSLLQVVSLVSCNNQEEKDESKKDDPVNPIDPVNPVDPVDPTPAEVEPLFGDIQTFEGKIDSNIPLNLGNGYIINLSLLTSNVSFSYQIASNINDIDAYKGFKFHLNLDLYSDETSFTTSLLTQMLLPKLFSDFKYTQIVKNVSDLDIYYLGDGALYTTISTFKGDEESWPSRDDKEAVKNSEREVINVTKMDCKGIISTISENIKNSKDNFDIKSALSTISGHLAGKVFDVDVFYKIITSSSITFLVDGFNFKLKEEGMACLSNYLNGTLTDLINNSSLGVTIPKDTNFLDLGNFEVEYVKDSFMLDISSKISDRPIFRFEIASSENNAVIEPSINLEENYLYMKELVNKVDELYLGYTNFELSEEYKAKYQKLIDEINALSETDFKTISKFNSVNGYKLLEEKDDGSYGFLSMYDKIVKDYNDLSNGILNLEDNDRSRLELFEHLEDFYFVRSSYSEYLRDNIINKIKDEDSVKFDNFITTFNNFFNSKLEVIVSNTSSKIKEYNESEEKTLEKANKVLNDSYFDLYDDDIVVDGDGIWDSSDLDDSSVITSFSNNAYNHFYNISLFNPYKNEEFSKELYDFTDSYLNLLSDSINNIDDLSMYKTYSSYLLFSNKNQLYKIFNLSDLISSSSYEASVKEKYESVIDTLVSKVDELINNELDKVIKEEDIYKLNNLEKLNYTINLLDETYNKYYSEIIKGNRLLSRYTTKLTCISKYKTLKSKLQDELKYYNN